MSRSNVVSTEEWIPFGIFAFLTLLSFLAAAYSAVQSLRVAGSAEPGVDQFYNPDLSLAERKRYWIAHLLVAKEYNGRLNINRAGWLKNGQIWFVVGIGFLLVSAIVLFASVGISSKGDNAGEVTTTSSPVSDSSSARFGAR